MQGEIVDALGKRRTAESTAETWRLFLKALIKTGISVGRNVSAVGKAAYSEANKIVAEAKSELDRDTATRSGSAKPGEWS